MSDELRYKGIKESIEDFTVLIFFSYLKHCGFPMNEI